MTDYDKIKSNRTAAIDEKDFDTKTKTNINNEEPPKAQPLKLKGGTSVKKQNLLLRTVHAIFPNGFKGIGEYLTRDVLLPAIKDMTWQAGNSALSMLIYRDNGHTGSNSNIRYGGSGGWNTPNHNNNRGRKSQGHQ